MAKDACACQIGKFESEVTEDEENLGWRKE